MSERKKTKPVLAATYVFSSPRFFIFNLLSLSFLIKKEKEYFL